MWYLSTANAGQWHWVKSEHPIKKEYSDILDEFIKEKGITKVIVSYTTDCYFSKCELINDETLETIYVDAYYHVYGNGELHAYDMTTPHWDRKRLF